MLKVTCLKVANEISSLQFKLAPSAWCEISLVISIHVIFLHLAYVDNQPEIDYIKYFNAQIDVDKLWFPEPFFQLPNTLCGFYNQQTNTTLCILLVNVTKHFIIISGTMFYCAITRSNAPYRAMTHDQPDCVHYASLEPLKTFFEARY